MWNIKTFIVNHWWCENWTGSLLPQWPVWRHSPLAHHPTHHNNREPLLTSHFSLLSPPTTKLKLSKNRILNCQLFTLMYFIQAGSSLLTMETKQKMSDMEMLISDNTQCSALFTTFHINGRGASVECRRWRSPGWGSLLAVMGDNEVPYNYETHLPHEGGVMSWELRVHSGVWHVPDSTIWAPVLPTKTAR